MMTLFFKRICGAAVAAALLAAPAFAQGFGESSFDDTGPAATTTAPAPSQPAPGGGGFDDSSFEPGGAAVAGIAPPQGGSGSTLPETPQGDVITPAPNPAPAPPPRPNAVPDTGIDAQITAFETRDFGVPPQTALRQGEFHAPTPTAIPGGYLVTTANLADAINNGTQMVIIDVLGSDYGLPNAYSAPALASAGSLNDRTQQQATRWLAHITGNNTGMPIVIYCSDPNCWLSYNASLRSIAAGYTQVYWYRGGLRAWQMVGLPLQPNGF